MIVVDEGWRGPWLSQDIALAF